MVEERVFQVSKGMGWKIAKRIWEPKQFHIVGESRVRQRAAARWAGARRLDHVCPGKQYGLYLLGRQRILKYVRGKLGRTLWLIGCRGKAAGEMSKIRFSGRLILSSTWVHQDLRWWCFCFSRSGVVWCHVKVEKASLAYGGSSVLEMPERISRCFWTSLPAAMHIATFLIASPYCGCKGAFVRFRKPS